MIVDLLQSIIEWIKCVLASSSSKDEDGVDAFISE